MLRGEHVYIRPLEVGDLERSHGWINNSEIFVTMGVFGPRTVDEQRRWYEGLIGNRANLVFALCTVDGEQHVGNVSLFAIDYRNRNAGLTIFIADEAHRSQGYGREAVRLLCKYGFDYLNLHRIYCRTDNPAAARMYEKLGFRKEGVLRQESFHYGEYVDKLLYGVLRSEFDAGAGSA